MKNGRFATATIMAMAMISAGVGCGKVNDSQHQDVANIVGGIGGKNSNSGSYLNPAGAQPELKPDFVGLINQQLDSALWMSKFRIEAGQTSNLGADSKEGLAPFSCSPSTVSTCNLSCPTASTYKIACTVPSSTTNTCNGIAYIFSNQSVSVTLDVSAIVGSGAGETGSLGLGLTFSADVNGGNLTGKTLACSMSLIFDVSKVKSTTPQKPALDCNNFNCTYDGKALDCAKLQADFNSSMSCT